MKIILLKDDKNLGKAGTLTDAKDGYARNFLFPKKIAIEATEENLAKWKEEQKRLQAEEDKNRQDAMEFKKRLESEKIVLKVKAGDNGRLFGAITSQNIADEMKNAFGEKLDKRKIVLSENIKTEGIHTVEVKLFQDISAKLKVVVEGIR
ncbi:50S ribosomal protein L9 [Peptoniphilus sp.]|uniref:50S ribosomal protein L9 n=1 Tax=Peptoniphilus sp. TaxID=1971214 RepID=UPI003995B046